MHKSFVRNCLKKNARKIINTKQGVTIVVAPCYTY